MRNIYSIRLDLSGKPLPPIADLRHRVRLGLHAAFYSRAYDLTYAEWKKTHKGRFPTQTERQKLQETAQLSADLETSVVLNELVSTTRTAMYADESGR